jgi:hypothetical protein
MSRNWIVLGIVLFGLAGLLLLPAKPAQAQEPSPTPENDANCVSCHEHQYYLYDSGKWFCLCEAPMHCVYCHGGQTDSYVKDTAHEGLVLYPTRNQAERCQTCHTEDYMSRVVTFETVAGVSNTPVPIITATPVESVVATANEPPSNPLLMRLSQLEPWKLVGLGGLGIVMVAILFFGYRCWKADCVVKNQP